MTIECKLTVQDYLAAQRLHFRPKPVLRWALIVVVGYLAAMLLHQAWTIAHGGALQRGWWMLPAGLAYGAFMFFILLPWRVAKIFKERPALAQANRFTFNDQGMLLEATRGQLQLKWPALKRWKRNRDYILLYHTALHFHIFPRRCFAQPQEFDAFAAFLTQHIGPALK